MQGGERGDLELRLYICLCLCLIYVYLVPTFSVFVCLVPSFMLYRPQVVYQSVKLRGLKLELFQLSFALAGVIYPSFFQASRLIQSRYSNLQDKLLFKKMLGFDIAFGIVKAGKYLLYFQNFAVFIKLTEDSFMNT